MVDVVGTETERRMAAELKRHRAALKPQAEGDLTSEELDTIERHVTRHDDPSARRGRGVRALLAEVRRHRAAQPAGKEHVRSVVSRVVSDELPADVVLNDEVSAIADRVAEQLSAPAPELEANRDRVRQIVRDAFCYVDCLAGHPDAPRVADRIAEQMSAPVLSASVIRAAVIHGAHFAQDRAKVADSGCGPSIDWVDEGRIEEEAARYTRKVNGAPTPAPNDQERAADDITKHWRRAGELLTYSSLGGKTSLMVQHVLCAALQWSEDEAKIAPSDAAAHAALTGPRRVFDEAKRAYQSAVDGEKATRDELLAYVHALETTP